ncbi:MAG: sugar transferase [Clostridiales bacterium]|jgi:O-antigen biosynthesis protein WbqP|nr:sugar transferase [Clostridiales bacterium]
MYKILKRILDFLASLLGSVVLLPVFLILACLIKAESRGPVFFKQKRFGKNKKFFYIYKFRTMKTDTPKDVPTHLLSNPSRFITKTGRFLRRFSLDELPQIFNILKGDMSFVGPRPALWNQEDLIALRDLGRCNSLTPGLTGLAQIKGRDELPLEVKANYDNEYAEKMSLVFDMGIILKTAVKAVAGDGVKEGV